MDDFTIVTTQKFVTYSQPFEPIEEVMEIVSCSSLFNDEGERS
jgi:hypothetical protein